MVKDREAWNTAVHGVARVRLNLVTEHQWKQQQQRKPESAAFSCLGAWMGDEEVQCLSSAYNRPGSQKVFLQPWCAAYFIVFDIPN